ncbi:glycosyltransferase [Pseudomonas multiresinivorans]|uniref:Glycosyltransferase n=1 Tax=Pseudomonas multiresinivorans TaxID=95301 RepID=A0A7Z3GNA1_9PSED|nr:glycosyltransferase [Pseudomonas multiresinivorans]QJP06765.1 glycosyltransferase [Pseudomonas multiresinivorans]
MRFLVHSEVNSARIEASLGLPDYSYYFVLKEFLPLLRGLGEVRVVEQVEEVDSLYRQACEEGEECVFLSFAPPHKTPLNLQCPTVPVFAWEFDSIPNQQWLEDDRQNWAAVLQRCGRAITHSGLTVEATRAELGAVFPVVSIPAPVWDRFAPLRQQPAGLPSEPITLTVRSGVVMDTHDLSLAPYIPNADAVARAVASARARELPVAAAKAEVAEPEAKARQSLARITLRYLVEWYRLAWRAPVAPVAAEPAPARMEPPNPVEPGGLPDVAVDEDAMPALPFGEHRLTLSGVVFTAVFNPYDGRKNWVDMLTAFCTAFRDKPEATLLFKLGHHEYESAMNDMLMCMARMPAFECRVVLLHGYLDRSEFDELIRHTAYIVNASHGEGQCLPLMEFLSCGKPAVAPRHSAMVDYIDESVAFEVATWLDATAWPHDPRLAYRTLRHQIDWASLVEAYRSAFQCYTQQPERYARMSNAAIERMRTHCSLEAGRGRLEAFLAACA